MKKYKKYKKPVWKYLLDKFIVIALLPINAVLWSLIALYIKSVSKGPVLFKQTRIGAYGKPFSIYKFRTMHHKNKTKIHEEHIDDIVKNNKELKKMDHKDPRIIKGGKFLRKSGLDELPQLINVWKNEMSIVGPRPCTEYEFYKLYKHDTSAKRFSVTPGITGLWQVSGKHKLTFTEMIALDEKYVSLLSIWNDFKIIIKTPLTIVGHIAEK